MNMRFDRGFTLIELLVVIAIIGMLSSVVLASLNSARQKSRDARRLSDIKQIQTALELYFDDQTNPEYPDSLSSLVPNYMPAQPKDPLALLVIKLSKLLLSPVAYASGGGGGGGSSSGDYYYDNLSASNSACSAATGVCTRYVLVLT